MSCHIALSLSTRRMCVRWQRRRRVSGSSMWKFHACKNESLMHTEVFPTNVYCNAAAHRITTCGRRRLRRVSFAVVAFCGISILFCTPTVSCRLTLRIPYVWHVCLLIWKFVSVLSHCTVCVVRASLQWDQSARARSVSCHEYVMKDCTIRIVVHIAPSNKKFPFALLFRRFSSSLCHLSFGFRTRVNTHVQIQRTCAPNEMKQTRKKMYKMIRTSRTNDKY